MKVYIIVRENGHKLQVLDDDYGWSFPPATPHCMCAVMYGNEDKANEIAEEYEGTVVEIDLGNLE